MARATKSFETVSPSETVDRGFDYCDGQLAAGEVVASAAFTVEVDETAAGATVDPSPNSRKSGSPDVEESEFSGLVSIAVQRLAGMIAGNKYRVICRATTDNGQVLEMFSHMWCRTAD